MTKAQGASLAASGGRLARFAPGLPALLHYRPADLPHDLIAGLSVAAVALPVGVAYAQLAGLDPVTGLYASLLPLVAYALFGTSKQLIVGPDAATCTLLAASVVPLAGGDPGLYLALTLALTLLTGVYLIGASFLRLGALADFLSKPILVGYLNGISLSIMAGQLGKLFGFTVDAQGILPKLVEVVNGIEQTHWPTLAVGLGSFAVLLLMRRLLPRLPAALVVLVLAGFAAWFWGLDDLGVAVIGAVPAGLPALGWPSIPLHLLDEIAAAAAGLALISFSSTMLTARAFAAKNRYEIQVDKEMAALGAANIAAGLTQSFAIAGADSRTAMNDSAGGRTRAVGLVAAGTIALVLLFLTEPLRFLPIAALGAVLIVASLSLLNLKTLLELLRVDRLEFALALLATFGVIWVGALKAILVVVTLALARFIYLSARPRVEVLGGVAGLAGLHSIDRHPGAKTEPGLVLLRLNAPLVFFNAAHFKQQALAALATAGPDLRWLVLDAVPITGVDYTGYTELADLAEILRQRGAELVLAGRMAEVEQLCRASGIDERRVFSRSFPSLRAAVKAYRRQHAVESPAVSPG
ncbi:MAG: sulfate permease [Sphingobacteriia bacterium]|nr:sulfate permease [Sphingobacteriia bacterium]NCC41394.1 sulfate permease [Gammaproteobacteria bacterium]